MNLAASVTEIRPEKQLLLYCARMRLDADRAERMKKLVGGELNWEYLLAAAAEHGVTPLLYRQLTAVCPADVPPSWMEQLQERYRRNTIRVLYLTTELLKILDRFQASGIRAIPHKGPVLAARAYGDVTLREFDDLDIIIRQSSVAVAHEQMTSLGYRAEFPPATTRGRKPAIPGEYGFVHQSGRCRVELHTEYTLRHFPKRPDLDELFELVEPVPLSDREVFGFFPEVALPILCIHGAKDFWQRLEWVADVAELAQTARGLNWAAATQQAQQLGAERMMDLGLYLASDLLGAALPEEILNRLRGDRVVCSVAAEVRKWLLRDRPAPPKGLGRARFRLRMGTTFPEGIRYLLRLATAPGRDGALHQTSPARHKLS